MVLVPHAFNATNHKAVLLLQGAVEEVIKECVGRWASAAAITSLSLTPNAGNFVSGSIFLLGVVDERYLVEEIEDAAADFSPTFDDIPQMEGDLVAVGYARSDDAAAEDDLDHDINHDGTDANYHGQQLEGHKLLAAAAATGAQSVNTRQIGNVVADNATANVFSPLVLSYSQYIKGNQPHVLSASGYHETAGPNGRVAVWSGRRANTEPINSIMLTPRTGTDFKAGSLFSLYLVPKRLIDRQELTAAAGTITFDNIPDDFEALVLVMYARSSRAAGDDLIDIACNGDTTAANYDVQQLYGAIAAVTAARSAGLRQVGYIPADTEGAGEYGGGLVILPGYSETDHHKHILSLQGRQENLVNIQSGRWENTDAISTIALTLTTGPNFLAGSIFELWGILPKAGLPASEGMKFGV